MKKTEIKLRRLLTMSNLLKSKINQRRETLDVLSLVGMLSRLKLQAFRPEEGA